MLGVSYVFFAFPFVLVLGRSESLLLDEYDDVVMTPKNEVAASNKS